MSWVKNSSLALPRFSSLDYKKILAYKKRNLKVSSQTQKIPAPLNNPKYKNLQHTSLKQGRYLNILNLRQSHSYPCNYHNKLKNYSRSLGKQMYYDNLFKKEIEDRFEPTVVDLLMKLLCYDSKKRITAEEALKHSFFTANPPMCRNDEMPVFKDEFHELDINERLDGNKVGNITNLLNENMMVGKKYEFWSYNDVTKNSTTDNRNEFNYLSNKRRNNNVLL
jgi:serine/threonine protein kinase